ncbi:MAG TPA: endolytic transglycosylase MltG [Candidatus Eisenbacteria bacterium]|nr:endolytic transglycosylase MltG [Candidatus Eisenbacteria bacterium]
MKRRHRIRRTLILGGIVGMVLLSGILFFPASVTRNYQTREVLIPRGAGVETIAGILKANGLVQSPTLFVLAARVLGHDRSLKAGRYTVPVGASMYRILRLLSTGMGKQDMVMIPEGLRSDEISRILAAQCRIDPSRFLALTRDSAFASSLGVPADRLEGYLYPDTYPFYPLLSPEEVVRVMVGRSLRVFEEEMGLPGAREGLTMHELVTLASIVEAEASMPSERPRIAAVFYNRLKRGMMLQSDPTVTYALGITRNRVFYSDLNVRSPYNTYRNRGLPPGPICSPGRAAMHAVLFPLPDSTELYFVARGDGTHIFSKSWEAHLAAIAHVRAVAKVESATTFFGPMPPPPVLRAAPDSTAETTRAEVVSAPSRNDAVAAKKELVSGPKSPVEASKKATASSARKKEAVSTSKKKPLHPVGPPAPEGTASSKHKKRAARP